MEPTFAQILANLWGQKTPLEHHTCCLLISNCGAFYAGTGLLPGTFLYILPAAAIPFNLLQQVPHPLLGLPKEIQMPQDVQAEIYNCS